MCGTHRLEESWENLIAGESAAAEITQFDHSRYPVHFACEPARPYGLLGLGTLVVLLLAARRALR